MIKVFLAQDFAFHASKSSARDRTGTGQAQDRTSTATPLQLVNDFSFIHTVDWFLVFIFECDCSENWVDWGFMTLRGCWNGHMVTWPHELSFGCASDRDKLIRMSLQKLMLSIRVSLTKYLSSKLFTGNDQPLLNPLIPMFSWKLSFFFLKCGV